MDTRAPLNICRNRKPCAPANHHEHALGSRSRAGKCAPCHHQKRGEPSVIVAVWVSRRCRGRQLDAEFQNQRPHEGIRIDFRLRLAPLRQLGRLSPQGPRSARRGASPLACTITHPPPLPRVSGAHKSPASANERCRPRPIMTWSYTGMSSSFPASTNCLVTARSSAEGVGSPLG